MSLTSKIILSSLGAIFFSLSYPVTNYFIFPFGNIIGLIFYFLSLPTKKDRFQSYFIPTACFLFFCNIIGVHWIINTIHIFGQIPYLVALILGLLFFLILMPQFIIFSLFKYILDSKKLTLRPLHLAVIWMLFEIITPTQFPISIGHPAFIFKKYLSFAPVFGQYIYSLLAAWISFSLSQYIQRGYKDFLCAFVVILTIIFSYLFPIDLKQSSQNLNVRMVQGNIGNAEKVQSEFGNEGAYEKVITRYKNLSLKNASIPLDLIIWPETAYPFSINKTYWPQARAFSSRKIKEILKLSNVPLFFGGYERKQSSYSKHQFETTYNSGIYVYPNQKDIFSYQKHHLLPFGETMPFGPLNKFIAPFVPAVSFFARGNQKNTFSIKNYTFISVICYEILFPNFVRSFFNNKKIDFIINLTNDSWFGQSSEQWLHLTLAHWRSLELGIPIIRSTNTGISTILYPDGSSSEHIPLYRPGVLDHQVKLSQSSPTLFTQWGQLPLALLILILLGVYTTLNNVMNSKHTN